MKGLRSTDNCYVWSPKSSSEVSKKYLYKPEDTKLKNQKFGHSKLRGMLAINGDSEEKKGKIKRRCQMIKPDRTSHKKVQHLNISPVRERRENDLIGPRMKKPKLHEAMVQNFSKQGGVFTVSAKKKEVSGVFPLNYSRKVEMSDKKVQRSSQHVLHKSEDNRALDNSSKKKFKEVLTKTSGGNLLNSPGASLGLCSHD